MYLQTLMMSNEEEEWREKHHHIMMSEGFEECPPVARQYVVNNQLA